MKKYVVITLMMLFLSVNIKGRDYLIDTSQVETKISKINDVAKIGELQKKLDETKDELNDNIASSKQDVKDILNTYAGALGIIIVLVSFSLNFFGKEAIKKRVEEIISETAQKQADTTVLTILNSRITTELIIEIVKEKSEAELKKILVKIENKGDNTITEFKNKGNEFLNSLLAAPQRDYPHRSLSSATDDEINKANEEIQAEEFFEMAFGAKNPKIRIELYRNVISLQPENYAAFNNMGVSFNDISKYNEAIEAFNNCIDLNPNYSIAYSNRAHSYNRQEKLELSLQDVEKAIELDSKNETAYSVKGNVFTKQQKFIEAEEALNRAINLNPNSSIALFNRGFFYEERQMYERSEADYLDAEQNGFSNKAMLYNNFAVLYRRQRKFDKAIDYIRKAREQDPDFSNLDGTLALIYADQGMDNEFYLHLDSALQKGCPIWNYLSDYGFDNYRDSKRLTQLIETYKRLA